jgi:hypothetical protein
VSFRYTLALLAVAIVVVLGFTLAQRQSPPASSGPAPSAPSILIDLRAADVTDVDIKTSDKETELAKSGPTWSLVKPNQEPNVDQAKIGAVVGQLAPLNALRSVAKPGEDVGPYGLRTPQLTVVLSSGGKTQTLLVGDKNVNGNQYFAVRQEGSDVGLISASLVNALMDMVSNPPKAAPTPVAAPSSASAAPSA